MTENPTPEENLAEEFRSLGKNLVEALRAAWDNPERRRLQQEIESGLAELGSTMKREAESFSGSPSGQQLKSDVEQLGKRIRSGEAHEKVRTELIAALKTANAELQKVVEKWSVAEAKPETPPAPSAPDHPDQAA